MEYHTNPREGVHVTIRIISEEVDPVKLSRQLAARVAGGLKLVQGCNNFYRALGRFYYSIPGQIREDFGSDLAHQSFSASVDHIPQLAIDLLESTIQFDHIRANVLKIEPMLMAVEIWEHEFELRAIEDRLRILSDDIFELVTEYEQNLWRYSDHCINCRSTLFAAWARHTWEVQGAIRMGFLEDDDEDIFDFMLEHEDQFLDTRDGEHDESQEAERELDLEVKYFEDDEYDEYYGQADDGEIDLEAKYLGDDECDEYDEQSDNGENDLEVKHFEDDERADDEENDLEAKHIEDDEQADDEEVDEPGEFEQKFVYEMETLDDSEEDEEATMMEMLDYGDEDEEMPDDGEENEETAMMGMLDYGKEDEEATMMEMLDYGEEDEETEMIEDTEEDEF